MASRAARREARTSDTRFEEEASKTTIFGGLMGEKEGEEKVEEGEESLEGTCGMEEGGQAAEGRSPKEEVEEVRRS